MRTVLAAFMLVSVLIPAAIAAQQVTPAAPPPRPCATAEHRQFDFWVGEWGVTTPDGRPAGTNRIEVSAAAGVERSRM